MRTVLWDEKQNEIRLIDQRLLPGRFEIFTCNSLDEVVFAIRDMVVRGAPAIGATAAFGMALAACRSSAASEDQLRTELRQAAQVLNNSRPTAVNLTWATRQMVLFMDQISGSVGEITESLIAEAQRIADEDVVTNKRMAEIGAELIQDGDTIIHHCNTGALAAVDWGTALGVIRQAHEQGKRIHVLVDETRPRLQGARLTAWELEQLKISYEIISDNAAGHFLRRHQADKVFFGADRVAANGDVANKVGSYMLALAAHANHVPVYSVFPTSTVDLSIEHGDQIPIEERNASEVLDLQFHGERVAPEMAKARNPAFDVTPNHLFTALVTEKGVVHQPLKYNLPRIVRAK